jgi:hypothetical protein
MAAREVRCRRCNRRSPNASVKYFRNSPLGPTCYDLVVARAQLRGQGPNPRVVEDPDSGLPHKISDWSTRYCPHDDLHCLACPNSADKQCPLERAVLQLQNQQSRS